MAHDWKTSGMCPVLGARSILAMALLLGAGCGEDSPPRQVSENTPPSLTISDVSVIPATPNQEPNPPAATPEVESQASSPLTVSGKTLSSLAQGISAAYESAKAQGLTAATNARDWLFDDLNSSNRWEYKIVSMAEEDPTQWEQELNKLGRDGWQCFHVQSQGPTLFLFLQRHPSSISRNIPMSDLLKVLPLLGLSSGDR